MSGYCKWFNPRRRWAAHQGGVYLYCQGLKRISGSCRPRDVGDIDVYIEEAVAVVNLSWKL